MDQTNPLYGKAWIEPHAFWLAIASLAVAFWLYRRMRKRERQWEELRKHEEFKKAMERK